MSQHDCDPAPFPPSFVRPSRGEETKALQAARILLLELRVPSRALPGCTGYCGPVPGPPGLFRVIQACSGSSGPVPGHAGLFRVIRACFRPCPLHAGPAGAAGAGAAGGGGPGGRAVPGLGPGLVPGPGAVPVPSPPRHARPQPHGAPLLGVGPGGRREVGEEAGGAWGPQGPGRTGQDTVQAG